MVGCTTAMFVKHILQIIAAIVALVSQRQSVGMPQSEQWLTVRVIDGETMKVAEAIGWEEKGKVKGRS